MAPGDVSLPGAGAESVLRPEAGLLGSGMGRDGDVYLPHEPGGSPHPQPRGGKAGLYDRNRAAGGRALHAGKAAAPSGLGGRHRGVRSGGADRVLLRVGYSDRWKRDGTAGGDPAIPGEQRRSSGVLRLRPEWGGHPQPCAAGDPGTELGGGERVRLPGQRGGTGAADGSEAAGPEETVQSGGPAGRTGAAGAGVRGRSPSAEGNVGNGGTAFDLRRGGHRDLRHPVYGGTWDRGGADVVYPDGQRAPHRNGKAIYRTGKAAPVRDFRQPPDKILCKQ